MDLDSLGDSQDFVRLLCDLQTEGWTLVRKGWRTGMPVDEPSIWVFCPLLRDFVPRDRVLVKGCEKCPHYKGVSHDIPTALAHSSSGTTSILQPQTRPDKDYMKNVHEMRKLKEEFLKAMKAQELEKNGKND